MKPFPYRTFFLLIGVLLVIIVPFCLFGDRINIWTDNLLAHTDDHPIRTGAALSSLLAVDILFPIPSSLVSTACGMALGFMGGACASFVGMTISAATGILIGRTCSTVAQRLIGPNESALLQSFNRRYGVWLLLALRPVPVLAEASVVFSGIARQPFGPALGVTLAGNAAVSTVYAAIGVWGRLSDSFLPAFGVSMLLSGFLLIALRLKRTTSRPPLDASRS